MEVSNDLNTTEALQGEDGARPYEPEVLLAWSLSSIRQRTKIELHPTLNSLIRVFGIQGSAVGLLTLLDKLNRDIKCLEQLIVVPAWAEKLELLHSELRLISPIDHVRDQVTLQRQPRSDLRSFLTPIDAALKPDQHRAIRSVRALVSLRLLALGEGIPGTIADAIGNCLKGRSLKKLGTAQIGNAELRAFRNTLFEISPEARLLTYALEALDSPLTDPFVVSTSKNSIYGLKHGNASQHDSQSIVDDSILCRLPADPLRGFLAEEYVASIKKFSGIPDLYDALLPFELEWTLSTVLTGWGNDQQDERLATALTLFTRVLPQHFDRVPLHPGSGAGVWLDIKNGCICWNLDEVLASHKTDTPFIRSPNDRYILIPLPAEIIEELRRRYLLTGGLTLASLFQHAAKTIGIRTKRFLRKLSISSHRPTLSRLSGTWARYTLTLCQDELYASALGIDCTVGTKSNHNYATLRGKRIYSILEDAYKRIGFSGQLAMDAVPDIESRRLPCQKKVAEFVEASLLKVEELISSVPKRISLSNLKETHNQIAIRIYAVFKLLSGGRALQEETVTYSKLDLLSGLTELSDKRTSPYHEMRVICLPPTLRAWMRTYIDWLRLLAYRLSNENRRVSEAIASTLNFPLQGDRIPLFFIFDDGNVTALGSEHLAPIFREFGLKNNAGRHFIDTIFRAEYLDSASIMGWMGRGYPGQELFGRYSTVIPLDPLNRCAGAIERWLAQRALPRPPTLSPRSPKYEFSPLKKSDTYIPQLLLATPDALTEKISSTVQPCPIQTSDVHRAAFFPRLIEEWRRTVVPQGWHGLALSLIFEDGVLLQEELEGVIEALQNKIIYRHQRSYFVDALTKSYGIRRLWLSPVSIRLLHAIKANEAPADFNSIESFATHFANRALPGNSAGGVGFIQSCMQAFLFFRVPSLLHSWMRGTLFARTSRPQTVAREITGFCEHPSYVTRGSKRERLGFNDLSSLYEKARDKRTTGSADKTVLAEFGEALAAIQPNYEPDSIEWLLAGYTGYLCNNQKTFSSVTRYVSACRPFLLMVVHAIAENGFEQVEWRTLTLKYLAKKEGETASAPDRAAVNHCLAWLGIDEHIGRRSGPPPSAFAYADRITQREGAQALQILRAKQGRIGDPWHRASLAFSLLLTIELRWDELAHLRLEDIHLGPAEPHVVITRESGARLKSKNAKHVAVLGNPTLVKELHVLLSQRKASFPMDSRIPFFGDETESRGCESLDHIHDLITQALFCATGSDVLRIHDARGTGLTEKFNDLLDTGSTKPKEIALVQRQAAFRISAQASHSTPGISLENYVHNLDVCRRKWIDKILNDLETRPSPTFAEGVTGVQAATYRQRARRAKTTSTTFNFFESFDTSDALKSGAVVRELDDLVVSGMTVVRDVDEPVRESQLIGIGIYAGLRLYGESTESSQLAAGLTLSDAMSSESEIESFQQEYRSIFSDPNCPDRKTFLESAHRTALAVAMHATSPHPLVIRRLLASVVFSKSRWELVDLADLIDASSWLNPWRAVGIEARIELKTSGSSRRDDKWIQCFALVGIKARIYKVDHFPRGVIGLVKFGNIQPNDQQQPFRSSRRQFVLVTTSLFAVHIFLKGQKNEKKSKQRI